MELDFQIGTSPVGGSVTLEGGDVRLRTLGIFGTDVLTTETAKTAMTAITTAHNELVKQMSTVGAGVARLQHAYSANKAEGLNLGNAMSNLADTDFIEDAAELAEAQLIVSTSMAMMAQMNTNRSQILNLFR